MTHLRSYRFVAKVTFKFPDWENFNNQSFLENFEKGNWNQCSICDIWNKPILM